MADNMTGLFGAPRRLPQISPELGAMMRQEPGMATPPTRAPQLAMQPEQPQKRDTLRRIAGYFADFTAGLNGQQGPYAAMLAEQQEQAERLRQASLERETDWQDWVRKQQWERANPAPPQDDAFDRALAGAGIDPNSEQGQTLYRQRAESLANPTQWITGSDGVARPVPRAAPTAPVGKLTPIEGGPGGSPSGAGFR